MQDDSIAIRLKFLIQKLGITNSMFADKCGIPRANLSQLLTGRNKKISDVVIRQIHEAYPSLSVTWLLFNEGNMWNGSPTESIAYTSTDSNSSFADYGDKENECTTDSADMSQNSYKNPYENRVDTYACRDAEIYSKENGVNSNDGTIHHSIEENVSNCRKTAKIINEIENFKNKRRKIVQITVYYDDSTFESFFPR